MNDRELLHEFVRSRSEEAFRTLVQTHLPLVLGTARRMTSDSALAEEIAQTVFVLLARKASTLRGEVVLAGWLFRSTRFVAGRALRAEQRRRRREQLAMSMQTDPNPTWSAIAPELDEALARLNGADRNALLLRYLEERSLREVGQLLGLSEEAAKKRVGRALEKLRGVLRRSGRDISAAALIGGLSSETSRAAAAAHSLTGKISASALANLSAGTRSAASAALLADTLTALWWTKVQSTVGLIAGLAVVALLVGPAIRFIRTKQVSDSRIHQAVSGSTASLLDGKRPTPGAKNRRRTVQANGLLIPVRTLSLTVLDSADDQPIEGASVLHFLTRWQPEGLAGPDKTDTNGTVAILVPESVPGGERMDQYEVQVNASGYAPREVLWLSTTGGVLATVSSQYTVRLERGTTLGGTILNEDGQALAGVQVGVQANNFRGYSSSQPEVRIDEVDNFFSSISTNATSPSIVTDAAGRFSIAHFPSALRALQLELASPDGAHRRFRTPEGKWLSTEELAEVPIEELRSGTARLVFAAGVNVEGTVVDASDRPIPRAQVVEGIVIGNLRVLSRSETDAAGRFILTNRPRREVILSASGEGHASVSMVVPVHPGMEPVRIQLPDPMPLRARVIEQSGRPIAGAKVKLVDYLNKTVALQWTGTSDAEGRFTWPAAPTNDVALWVSAGGFSSPVVRLRSAPEEQTITLRRPTGDGVQITGRVADASTGLAIPRFVLKLSHSMGGGVPDRPVRTVEGSDGDFELQVKPGDVPVVGGTPGWVLLIEAPGYEACATDWHSLDEGDHDLELRLQPGGWVEGDILTAEGEPAAGVQLAFARINDAVLSTRPGEFSKRNPTETADAAGHFRLQRPFKARGLVAFHDTGWAIVPLTTESRLGTIQLQPWGKIEGTVWLGPQPGAHEQVGLAKLVWDYSDLLTPLYSTTTDENGRFVFERLMADEFQLSVQSRHWQVREQAPVKALQAAIKLGPGETRTVSLGGSGCMVMARLRAPGQVTMPCEDVLAILRADVTVPPEPVASDFATMESHWLAHRRYASDPRVRQALRQARQFVGQMDSQGMVTFTGVTPGRYVFDARWVDRNPPPGTLIVFEKVKVLGQVKAPVNIAEPGTDAASSNAVFLGEFSMTPR